MLSINLRILVFLFAGFIYQSVFSQTFIGNGLIPQSHREEWTKAGLLRDMSEVEPKRLYNVRDESGSDWDQIQASLNKAKSHSSQGRISIVYFPAGNYYFSNEIEIGPADSNIVFPGAGSDKTFLIFSAVNKNSFQISGSLGSYRLLDQNTDIVKETTTITGDLALVSESDWVHFYDYDFWYEPPDPLKREKEIVGQITQIVTKNGSQATIKDQATRTYAAGNLRIRKVNPITNVGIEDLTIQRNSSSKATQDGKGMNINFADAVNCWVRGVQ